MKKRLLIIALAIVMVASFAGCGKTGTTTSSSSTHELALVTDLGTIDDKSFNQAAWEGLKKFATENNMTYQYYQPTEGSNDAYLAAIDLAVQGGAKVIVTPGYMFATPVYNAQTKYPNVKFILLDATPTSEDGKTSTTASNTLSILYQENEAGYYAGYAAVKDGFTKLGFQGGMSVPAVVRYGYGFLQGADAAAKEMNLAKGAVTINYNYSGDFSATPENQARAAGWYAAGTEIIFACGGSVGNSVMKAAEASTGKWVIGVDVDQYAESATVISSAMKMLGNSVYAALTDIKNNTFTGGRTETFNSSNDGVGLAMDHAKWRTFSKTDYDAIYAKVKDGTIKVNGDATKKISDLGLQYVTVAEK